jgi:zinc transport system substrate-binding protein
LVTILLSLNSAQADAAKQPVARISVFTSILPQAYFVEKIGGKSVDVHVLVGPGQSPETYSPTPKQMAQLSESDLLFTVGVPFEHTLTKRIAKIVPTLHIVNTAADIPAERQLTFAEDSGMNSDSHLHGDIDPHTWLDPSLVKIQSQSIRDALMEIDPANKQKYASNYEAFSKELDSLSADISKILDAVRGRDMLVFHPAFGHFAKAFGLRQIAIEQEGKEPGASRIATLVDRARAENVSVIFVQKQFSTSSADAIAEAIGAKVVPLDPLAKDYATNMISMANTIAGALAGEKIDTGE